MEKGLIKESEHPFCMGIAPDNVRFTTHYYEENFISSMYSVLHEGGHGLYEQNQDETLDTTLLQGGASMGIHESQSRTYENIFGRNYTKCANFALGKFDEIRYLGKDHDNYKE